MLYLYLMTNKNELTEQLIKDHVEHLKQLDAENKLVLCGSLHDYPGDMVVFNEDCYDQAILIAPPDDFGSPLAFDHYVRSLHSTLTPENTRFYFGGNDILKNKLREFTRNNPAVMAVGGLVHSLLLRCTWMDQTRENMFVLEEENYG